MENPKIESEAGGADRMIVSRRSLRRLYRWLAGSLILAVGFALISGWLAYRLRPKRFEDLVPYATENYIRNFHENVDFTKVYPGMEPENIEALQRETFGVTLIYEAYTEFRMAPVRAKYVNVSPHGFRLGLTEPPWPPNKDDFAVFCFGGSTTFGYGVADTDTFPAALEGVLQERFPDRRIVCYNFGRGFYQSTQERILFEQLLLNAFVPDLAVFLDGVNDFFFSDGLTRGARGIFHWISPTLEVPPVEDLSTDENKRVAAANTIIRIRRNHELLQILAAPLGIQMLFVGQPTPAHRFDRDPALYPFEQPYIGHNLCDWAYPEFEKYALADGFGPRSVWAGGAFEKADEPMYVDTVHYSGAGSRKLARYVVDEAMRRNLIQ